MSSIWAQFQSEFVSILIDGGVLMVPLTIVAFAIYFTALRLYFFFSTHYFYKVKRERLIELIFNPILAGGELRRILDYTQSVEIEDINQIKNRFTEVISSYLVDVDTKRAYLLVLITTAPLMGLLGTVMGMLKTFNGLAVTTGTTTVDQIAAGISEALITTQTGLIIAIPAYVMATLILKRRNEMEACLTTMEALTVQRFETKSNSKSQTS